jgi:hypothetical protein
MATYASYKKVATDSIVDGTVQSADIAHGNGNNMGVAWVYNARGMACHTCSRQSGCCEQANGKCCYWCVPDGASTVTFEIWSGGGGGPGHTCCNCCSFTIGGAGGNYASKTINTTPGCQYSICAGGSWPCGKAHTCSASLGCKSYINGHNLSNFCTIGGCGGWMCNGDAWGPRHTHFGCENCNICGIFGADFGAMGTTGWKAGHGGCHCNYTYSGSGQPPMIGKMSVSVALNSWCNCGCAIEWPSGGGNPGTSSYCGNWAKCCAGGSGQGGSGVVRITFM